MYRSAPILLSISFVLACCSSIGPASSEPGQAANQMPRPTLEIAPAPLNELANRAEALSPILDIYQITLQDDGDLIVFTFMRLSETSDNPTQDLRESTEAIWEAAMQADIDLSQVSVTYLRTQNVVSLDYGPVPSVP
jgi:hypothetical protein